jgi:4-diphosphocytidyl-2-C-methyl-D-erythritol kinase
VTLCGMTSTHIVGVNKAVCGMKDSSKNSLTLSCPAKLNVFLEIHGKRPDGYHELETVMLRTSLVDQLTIRPSDSESLTLRFSDATPDALRAGVPLDQTNLILRAAEAVRQRLGQSRGAEFILHKRIPPESGLAGGSSNAAAALLACRQLWQVPVSDEELHEIAATLGSDVNFLLSGHRAAVCRGRGEMIEPITLNRRLYFVAVRPRRGNSTAEVFRATSLPKMTIRSSQIVQNLTGASAGPLNGLIVNRLTAAARKINPEMDEMMIRLQHAARRPVFMSGSGSTIFVVADTGQQAAKLQSQIRKTLHRSCWSLEC